jgi:hypothetical protein
MHQPAFRPTPPPSLSNLLPHAAPTAPWPRVMLVAIRRMAAHGLYDASASLLMMRELGLHFRKPLLMLRTLLLEIAQVARQPVPVAPCCALRMTMQERDLLTALAVADRDPALAEECLYRLTCGAPTASLLATLRMAARALGEAGRPLDLALDPDSNA